MKIVVGLGNPGKKYENTRHNAGFLALDFLILSFGFRISDFQNNFHSLILNEKLNNTKVIFAKPQTFMNNSGEAVKTLCHFYKIDVSKNLLVIHDDVDLSLGKFKLTPASSSAGHNGVQNIIEQLGSQEFHRLRLGVNTRNSRSEIDTQDFVLQNFTPEELKQLQEEVLPQAKTTVEKFLQN